MIFSLLTQQGSFFGDIRDRNDSRKNRQSSSYRLNSGADTPMRDDGFGGNLGHDVMGKFICY